VQVVSNLLAAAHAVAVQRAAGCRALPGASLLDALEAALGADAPLRGAAPALTHLLRVKRHERTAAALEARLRWKRKLQLTATLRATRGAYLLHSDAGSEFHGPGLPEPVAVTPASRQHAHLPTCAYCVAAGRASARVFVSRGGPSLARQWINAASEPPAIVFSARNLMCHDCAARLGVACCEPPALGA